MNCMCSVLSVISFSHALHSALSRNQLLLVAVAPSCVQQYPAASALCFCVASLASSSFTRFLLSSIGLASPVQWSKTPIIT